jgi:uroporphyrin-III C-methyltransferase
MDKIKQEIVRLKLTDTPLPDVQISGLPVFLPGWVWLAGAGPGDPGLLTLHAVNAMQQADVIIHDALVSEDILSIAGPDTEIFYAGKRGGKPSMKQADITDSLVYHARKEKKVLRLKGGDPFVFGRGGEEVERLVEEEISFRLIPGVTSGIAGPEYAGIPVTHRDVNHAVSFVTGHLAGSGQTELLDWESISKATPVIVVYMAMKKIDVIAEKLIQAGRSPEEPVAIITQATTPDQEVLTSTLRSAAADAKSAGLEPPSIIVFGAVASFADKLSWFDKQ